MTLIIVTADEVVDMIANSHHGEGLRDWAGDVRLALDMKGSDQLIIMVKGLNKYYSKLKNLQNKEFTAAARAGVAGKDISGAAYGAGVPGKPNKEAIEMEMVKLQMEKQCFLVHGEPVTTNQQQKELTNSGNNRADRGLDIQSRW